VTRAAKRAALTRPRATRTASEQRVARTAASGLSNREIAQDLFVTPRTVEMHLSNVFRELDISSRRQIAGRLGDEARAA